MSKVAVVTGGTRGIGHAISIELKNQGYQVVANYGGNDERPISFRPKPAFRFLNGMSAIMMLAPPD